MTPPGNGIITVRSAGSVEATAAKLAGLLQAKGVKLFADINHSGEAANVGLAMRATRLLIFGNPIAGTPLMVASPSIAIDLPLKILIHEDAEGVVWLSYNSAAYLGERHGVPNELLRNIAVVEALASAAAA
jgi:uncharacterized protein (DUF302 family)